MKHNQARRKQATGALPPGAVGGTRKGGEQAAEAVGDVQHRVFFAFHFLRTGLPSRCLVDLM